MIADTEDEILRLTGKHLEEWGIQIIFSGTGMIMATCFVALPLVIRDKRDSTVSADDVVLTTIGPRSRLPPNPQ